MEPPFGWTKKYWQDRLDGTLLPSWRVNKTAHVADLSMHKQKSLSTRALRAHTPRAPCMSCIIVQPLLEHDVDDLYLHLRGHSGHAEWSVHGCGYDGQQKDANCDVRGPCQTHQFVADFNWLVMLTSCIDVEIWRFSWWLRQLFYPCACARGKYDR